MRNNYKFEGHWYYSSPFVAPPYIDRVWRQLITYHKTYEIYCRKISGGVIERDDPRENPLESFEKYQALMIALDDSKDFIKPFYNLWPRYYSIDEFMADIEYNSYIASDEIPRVIDLMNEYYIRNDSGQINIQLCRGLADHCRNSFMFTSNPPETKVTIIHGQTMNNPHYVLNDRNPSETLNKVLSLIFPVKFLDNVMNDNLIDANTANIWILEYRKFITMAYHADFYVIPSEQVDLVWHAHMSNTQHYRYSCLTLLETEYYHSSKIDGRAGR